MIFPGLQFDVGLMFPFHYKKTYCVCFLGNNIDVTSRMVVSHVSGQDKKIKSTKVAHSSLCCNIF